MSYQIKSFTKIYRHNQPSKIRTWFWFIVLLTFAFLLLPWTQNIKSKGYVTTRLQENRPQQIQSPIAGKIVKWYVKEGDYVKKGDTILQLSEVKDNYLDPDLIWKTQIQVDAKKGSISYYESKANVVSMQIKAIEQGQKLKLEQLRNKLIQLNQKQNSEQAQLSAAMNELENAKDQLDRQKKMFDEGLVSLTQFQQRNVAYQNALAKKIKVENDLSQVKQDILNNQVEQNSVVQEYMEKRQKAESDRLSTMSDANTSRADVAKLENQVANYTIRNGMYIVTAPQDGQVIQAKKSGIGEIIKENETITTVVPTQNSYAIEIFVRPVDFPLIKIGQKVRFLFDGFPAIVFSGWPDGSYGTFGGEIVAFESSINDNGHFRVLVTESPTEKKWPNELKIGSGANGIILLNNVPIWYELWRNINGFPPDFYDLEKQNLKPKNK
jgi:multidrug resistance efflux pump